MTNLNELLNKIHDISVKSGWRNQQKSYEHYAALVLTEIAEAINADRNLKYAHIKEFEWILTYNIIELHLQGEDYIKEYMHNFKTYMKDTYEDELGDICIRLLDMADYFSLNVYYDDSVELKGNTLTEKMFYIIKDFIKVNSENSVNICLNKIFKLFNDYETLYKIISYKIEYNNYNAKLNNKKY